MDALQSRELVEAQRLETRPVEGGVPLHLLLEARLEGLDVVLVRVQLGLHAVDVRLAAQDLGKERRFMMGVMSPGMVGFPET